jgi:hypothetical protein
MKDKTTIKAPQTLFNVLRFGRMAGDEDVLDGRFMLVLLGESGRSSFSLSPTYAGRHGGNGQD